MTRDVQMYIIWPVDTRWYKYLLMIEVSEASFWEWCSFLGGIWIQNDSEDIDICGIVVMGRDDFFLPFSTWPMSFGLPTLRPMWILYLQTSAIPILTCQVSFALLTTMVILGARVPLGRRHRQCFGWIHQRRRFAWLSHHPMIFRKLVECGAPQL